MVGAAASGERRAATICRLCCFLQVFQQKRRRGVFSMAESFNPAHTMPANSMGKAKDIMGSTKRTRHQRDDGHYHWYMVKASPKVVLFVMLLGTFVSSTAQSMLTAALPSIMDEFAVDATLGQLLTTGYIYMLGIMSAMTAFLLTKCNSRHLFLAAVGCFIVGCIGALLATNYPVLLASRFLQACGNGILLPLVQTVAVAIYPRERRGFALGLVGMVISFAPVLGPTLSGVITDVWGWKSIFLVLGSLSLVSWVVAVFVVDDQGEHTPMKFDVPSCILFVTGLVCFMAGITAAEQVGPFMWQVYVPVLAAFLLLFLFVRRQIALPEPLLKVTLFKSKHFLLGVALVALAQIAMVAGTLQVPLYVQEVHGMSALESGLILLPGSLLTALISAPVGTFYDNHGMRISAAAGLSALAMGTLGFVAFNETTPAIAIAALYAVRMLGLTFLMMPMTAYALEKLSGNDAAHGTAIVNTTRQILGSLGSSLLVSMMALVTATVDPSAPSAASGLSAVGFNASFGLQAALFVFSLCVVLIAVKPKKKRAIVMAGETVEHALEHVESHYNPYDSLR